MSPLALLRAEIKNWERDFTSTHGRDPAVEDIRGQPHIAEKYRLYKRLSRLATPTKNRHPGHAAPSSSRALPAPTTAVSRARKRLRGEPVSPSPSKPKRLRVPEPEGHSSTSEHDDDDDLPNRDLASFVADSPVKPPAGGKPFKLLFEDPLPSLKPIGLPVSNPDSGPQTFHRPHDVRSDKTTSRSEHPFDRPQPAIQARIFPAKDHVLTSSHTPDSLPRPSSSLKRSLDLIDQHKAPTIPLQCNLVPPSPPSQDATNRDVKSKAKSIASRKRFRVEGAGSNEDTDSSDDMALNVATLDRGKHAHRQPVDLDWDPLLHLGTRIHVPAVEEQFDVDRHAAGTFSVNLPDKFRRVLAISPSRSQNSNEERVVRGLLYGLRTGHYDPSRGGDIWNAGEVDESSLEDLGTEDDWESEPVPWEVGEL